MMNLLNKTTKSVPTAALILGLSVTASRFLGLLRDRILAGIYGASVELDVYFAAFRIPDLIYSIIIGGAVTSAFIPVFISKLSNNKNEAWELARSFFYIAAIILTGVVFLVYIFMPHLIGFVIPGFESGPQDLAVSVSRIMLLSPLFLGLSAVFSGILHSFRKFFVYSLAPIFYNLGIITGALFFTEFAGVRGLAWGVALGAFMHMLIQAPVSFSTGFSLKPPKKLIHPSLKRVFRLIVPRAIGLGAYQVNLWVITAIASTITAGSITVFNLANHIQYLPIGIVGISYASAVFPNLSNFVALKNYKRYLSELSRALRSVFFIVFPLGILFFVLRAQIVRVVLGAGKFGWEGTQLTAAALGAFSLGLFAYALMPVLAKAFYAKEDTKTPVIASTTGMGINLTLALLLVYVIFPADGFLEFLSGVFKVAGVEGSSVIALPLAFSIGGISALVLLFSIFFRNKKNRIVAKEILESFIRIIIASVISGMTAWYALRIFDAYAVDDIDTFLEVFAQGVFAGVLGVLVYLVFAFVFKFEELQILIKFTGSKLKRNKKLPPQPPVNFDDTPGNS